MTDLVSEMTREISSIMPLVAKATLIAPIFALGFAVNAAAADNAAQESDSTKLRICAAADEQPYSGRDKSGFENKIAEVVAEVPGLAGNIVHDTQTAVLMREHGIRRICTRDTDFHRFPFLEPIDPLRVEP